MRLSVGRPLGSPGSLTYFPGASFQTCRADRSAARSARETRGKGQPIARVPAPPPPAYPGPPPQKKHKELTGAIFEARIVLHHVLPATTAYYAAPSALVLGQGS